MNREDPHNQGSPPGAAVYRGPMATDNFTQIHNLVLRGKTPIPTRYVGIWGFITSHVEGWKLTEQSIARELGVGRDFVRSALKSIEEAMCLIRVRDRDGQGHLREAAWFVTDLPIQLQQLGITDQATMRAKVQQAYEQWQSLRSSQPMLENPTLAVSCENPPREPAADTVEHGSPSSEPMSGFPTLADPTLGNPTPKKNKEKNTNPQEEHSPSVRPAGDAHAEQRAPDGCQAPEPDGRTEESTGEDHQDLAEGLLAEEEVADTLARLRPYPSQLRHLADLAAAALTRFELNQVRGYLLGKCRETTSRRISYVITAFEDDRIADIAQARPIPHADVRRAQQTELTKRERTPTTTHRERTGEPRQPASPAEPEQAPPSPVDWLTDEGFAALAPQDKAHLRVWGDKPWASVPKVAATRIAAIRNRQESAVA